MLQASLLQSGRMKCLPTAPGPCRVSPLKHRKLLESSGIFHCWSGCSGGFPGIGTETRLCVQTFRRLGDALPVLEIQNCPILSMGVRSGFHPQQCPGELRHPSHVLPCGPVTKTDPLLGTSTGLVPNVGCQPLEGKMWIQPLSQMCGHVLWRRKLGLSGWWHLCTPDL